MKKIVFTLLIINGSLKLRAQGADAVVATNTGVLITLQTSQLAQAIDQVATSIETLNTIKETIQQGKQIIKFTQQTAGIMQAIADDRISIEMINELKINDLKGLMKDMLCVNIDDFTPKDNVNLRVLLRFKNSLLSCSNQDYYSYTFAGINKKIKEGSFFKSFKNIKDVNQLSKEQLNYEINKIDVAIVEANSQHSFANTLNDEMLNASYKYYYNLAEELFDKSKDMYDKLKGVNSDGSAQIEMSQFERQQLIMASIEYQFKAFEYKEKSLAILQKLSSPGNNMKEISKIRGEMAARKLSMDVWRKY